MTDAAEPSRCLLEKLGFRHNSDGSYSRPSVESNPADVPDQSAEVDHLHERAELQKWMADQRAKASLILDLLPQHLPAEHRQEVEDYLANGFGCDCLRSLIRGDDGW